MKWFFQKKFVLKTALSPTQVQTRINENLEPYSGLRFMLINSSHLFQGYTSGNKFEISRIPSYFDNKNNIPEMSGEITQESFGSSVKIIVTGIALILYTFAVPLLIILLTVLSVVNSSKDEWDALYIPLVTFPVYFLILLIIRSVFIYRVKRHLRILADLIEADIT